VLYDFEVIRIYSGVHLGEWAQTDNVRRLDQIRLNIDGTPAGHAEFQSQYRFSYSI
jgi:hypothetical protein